MIRVIKHYLQKINIPIVNTPIVNTSTVNISTVNSVQIFNSDTELKVYKTTILERSSAENKNIHDLINIQFKKFGSSLPNVDLANPILYNSLADKVLFVHLINFLKINAKKEIVDIININMTPHVTSLAKSLVLQYSSTFKEISFPSIGKIFTLGDAISASEDHNLLKILILSGTKFDYTDMSINNIVYSNKILHLKLWINSNLKLYYSNGILEYAAIYKYWDIMDLLISNNFDVKINSDVILYLCEGEQHSILQKVLDKIQEKILVGDEPFSIATKKLDYNMLKILLFNDKILMGSKKIDLDLVQDISILDLWVSSGHEFKHTIYPIFSAVTHNNYPLLKWWITNCNFNLISENTQDLYMGENIFVSNILHYMQKKDINPEIIELLLNINIIRRDYEILTKFRKQ